MGSRRSPALSVFDPYIASTAAYHGVRPETSGNFGRASPCFREDQWMPSVQSGKQGHHRLNVVDVCQSDQSTGSAKGRAPLVDAFPEFGKGDHRVGILDILTGCAVVDN